MQTIELMDDKGMKHTLHGLKTGSTGPNTDKMKNTKQTGGLEGVKDTLNTAFGLIVFFSVPYCSGI